MQKTENALIKEEQRSYKREWRNKNREHLREYHRKWRQNNKEKVDANTRNYWLRKAQKRMEQTGNETIIN